MRYLALFKIKNSDFDYTKYGLNDVFFSIDITKSIQASKGVKTTQYPLLDGTTRIDTISRAPGTLNFQGNIGELLSAKSLERSVKASGDLTRMEVELALLEDLRDNAIVLDVITHVKTYRNYIIESIGAGVSQFGISDINLSMKELLTFGDEIEVEENSNLLYGSSSAENPSSILQSTTFIIFRFLYSVNLTASALIFSTCSIVIGLFSTTSVDLILPEMIKETCWFLGSLSVGAAA